MSKKPTGDSDQADAGRAAASTRRLPGGWNLSWNDGCEIRTSLASSKSGNVGGNLKVA